MKLLSKFTFQIIHKIFSKQYSKEFADITLNWSKIAGAKFHYRSCPKKITYIKNSRNAILHVNVYDSATNLELSFQQDIIIERIAIYLGYKSIHKLSIHLVPSQVYSSNDHKN